MITIFSLINPGALHKIDSILLSTISGNKNLIITVHLQLGPLSIHSTWEAVASGLKATHLSTSGVKRGIF